MGGLSSRGIHLQSTPSKASNKGKPCPLLMLRHYLESYSHILLLDLLGRHGNGSNDGIYMTLLAELTMSVAAMRGAVLL